MLLLNKKRISNNNHKKKKMKPKKKKINIELEKMNSSVQCVLDDVPQDPASPTASPRTKQATGEPEYFEVVITSDQLGFTLHRDVISIFGEICMFDVISRSPTLPHNTLFHGAHLTFSLSLSLAFDSGHSLW
jgi:hypothetical protein